MKYLIKFIVLVLSLNKFCFGINCNSEDNSAESRVKRLLFCNGYDSTVRPVKSHKTPTVINAKMFIKNLDFNEHGSTLTLNVWMVNKWKDEFLKWDKSEYDNLKDIDVTSSTIWRPDFALFNADISYGIGSCHETSCYIANNGDVICVEPCTYVAHCQSNYNSWPFDVQNCTMVFGPWMNSEDEIDYKVGNTSIDDADGLDTEWKLIQTGVTKKSISISSANYPNLAYYFVIERHSALILRIIGASIVILIIINILAMSINQEMNERFFLLIFNILLHFQTLHQLSWMIPHDGSTTPRILIFVRNSLITSCYLMLQSLVIRNMCLTESTPPDFIKSFVIFIKEKHLGLIVFGDDKENGKQTDENILIEPSEKTNSVNNKIWRNICSFLDRLSFLIVTALYVIMCFTLIPYQYSTRTDILTLSPPPK
ncbi:CLUMA_CG007436, isoform A [Clunio marinus]|uniref:CLUMA_CG007436, isoform A n=1 Tax=Clunio marinus TaxID=568069 RepID=A0A1J1I0W3_9DIPT|nr:CLUMA_CG007436, isoform A [Clunio marinus]